MYGLSVFGSMLLMFFATLLRAFGLGCICVAMCGSRILLPRCFVRGLPSVLCSGHERASTVWYCCADVQAFPIYEKIEFKHNIRPECICTSAAVYLAGSCCCTCTRILLRRQEERHLQDLTIKSSDLLSCELRALCLSPRAAAHLKTKRACLPPNMPSLPPSLTLCAGQAMFNPGIQILIGGSIALRSLQER